MRAERSSRPDLSTRDTAKPDSLETAAALEVLHTAQIGRVAEPLPTAHKDGRLQNEDVYSVVAIMGWTHVGNRLSYVDT